MLLLFNRFDCRSIHRFFFHAVFVLCFFSTRLIRFWWFPHKLASFHKLFIWPHTFSTWIIWFRKLCTRKSNSEHWYSYKNPNSTEFDSLFKCINRFRCMQHSSNRLFSFHSAIKQSQLNIAVGQSTHATECSAKFNGNNC